MNFNYGAVNLSVVNTGSPGEEATIRANVPGGLASLVIGGDTYNLLQFHFHVPAEHLLNGHQSPMELHMVHQKSSGELLVVGRWIEEGAFNPLLNSIFSQLPPNPGNTVNINNFNLGGLLPTDLSSYRYPGSLTTAPYTEGVRWIVLDDVMEMSTAQIAAFEALFPDGNSRATQALKGRTIQTDVVGFAGAPEPSSVLLLIPIAAAGLLVVRRRRAA